uniref:DNA polymerase n=1 Tax=Setaria digitata TaxID=48799 RepID=A0A915PKT3_9BILA
MRNVTCDYYLEKPNGFNRQYLHTTAKVPIIRMFGILETGQKCCVHVHGVFPYMIIRTGAQFTPEFASLLRNKIGAIISNCNSRLKFNADLAIYDIRSITARSLYGYYKNDENFVQILCYSPVQLKILADALQKEARRNSIFQVYESHVPYILQFFIDHSICGMDLVNFSCVKFRVSPLRNFSDLYYRDLTVENIVNNIEIVSPLLPTTTADVECDALAKNIINDFLHSTSGISYNRGLNYIWQDEKRRYGKMDEEMVGQSIQKERIFAHTEKELDYFRRLRVFLEGTAPTFSLGSMGSSVFQTALSARKSGRSGVFGNDFDTGGTNIFDEELFLETEDEMEEMMEDDEQEDIDLSQKVDEVCGAVSSADDTDAVHIDPDLVEGTSDESDSDGGIFPDASAVENSPKVGNSSQQSSQQSTNSNDLFENHESMTASTAPVPNPGQSENGLRNSTASQHSHLSFLFNTSSQASVFNSTSRKRRSHFLHEDEYCEANEGTINCAQSYEVDIESAWIPKCPQKSVLQEDLVTIFSKSERWLRPSKRLPLRKRLNQVRSTGGFFVGESVESVPHPPGQTIADQFYTSSFTDQLSFINYENTREILEQTLVIPSDTPWMKATQEEGVQHLCVMSMEILALTSRGMPVPDPQHDEILGIFYTISTDICAQDEASDVEGILLNANNMLIEQNELYNIVASETDLFNAFVSVIQRYDPDIVIGYNTQRYSWGYLIERSLIIGRNLLSELSRVPIGSPYECSSCTAQLCLNAVAYQVYEVKYVAEISEYYRPEQQKRNRWLKELDPTPRGRILINVWRILRHELALSILVLKYMKLYCQLNLRILLQLNFFTRTSEMARLYGIQFNEVLTRGSQFRVESMLLRLARREKYIAPSISPAQREAMCSPETLPLTMEPESGFYRDPVIVLDFQSLYPSIIIAYNYCFSTCLGKVSHIENICGTDKVIEFGGLEYNFPIDDIISMLKTNGLHISPAGAIFCRDTVRRGLMPMMLEEILNTRIMVKKAAKEFKKDRRLGRILEARQMALKLIANVTYGYAAANFSGRMPCVEVADAIVSKGRETLEQAIKLVNETAYENSRVIYGDTDSIFVVCPGATRTKAFAIGKKIADDVTRANPDPVKLKLEKIMHPLILESKKRYVGMSYESVDDVEGVFDAKGIETIRRDSCPLVSKLLEKALRLLFINDVNRMVRYLDMQLSNLSQLPLSDFIFSREYRKWYAETATVASKFIAEKRKALCSRYEPEIGERVSYVIVCGEPNSTLISCVRDPQEFIFDSRLKLNFEYYVRRQVLPTLHRALDFVPIKIEWHCPTTIGCYKCGALGAQVWCRKCIVDPKALLFAVCDCHQEKYLLAQLNDKCRKCLALRSIRIDYGKCINMNCIVKQKRVFLDRSATELAIKSHFLTQKKL